MGKHTPRPWQVTRVDYPDKQDVSFEIRGALHRGIFPVICQTFMRELKSEWHLIEQDEANMALIAAAPDLLEACKAALKALHGVLARAYFMESEQLKDVGVRPDALRCEECGYLSPLNDDRTTFKLNHREDCTTLEAIKAERTLDAVIARAEGREAEIPKAPAE